MTNAPAPTMMAADQEERFVLLGGFNDIFVLVGLILLCVGMVALAMTLKAAMIFMPLVYVGVFWGLAEIFTRRMRLALPSIVLMILFMLASFCYLMTVVTVGWGLLARFGGAGVATAGAGMASWDAMLSSLMTASCVMLVALVGTALAGLLHYRRFRVPIGPSLIFAALFLMVLVGVISTFPFVVKAFYLPMIGVFGLISLGVAIMLDLQDPERVTRKSDAAFWLHLQAAPMLCQATMQPYFRLADPEHLARGMGVAWLVLGIFCLWGLLALILNRRALIVSGLGYAAYALGSILYVQGLDKAALVAVCGLFIGSGVLVLAIWWQALRKVVLRQLMRLQKGKMGGVC